MKIYRVASQTNGTTTYVVVNSTCECPDAKKALAGWCKHRLSAVIYKRAQTLVTQCLGQVPTAQKPLEPLPASQPPAWHGTQAPASCTLKWSLNGIELFLTLRDTTDDALFRHIQHVMPRIVEKVDARRHASQADSQRNTGSGTGNAAQDDKPYCPTHGVPLTQYTKNGKVWYSHRTARGAWCQGK